MIKTVHIINKLEIGGVEVGVISLLSNPNINNYKVVTIKGADQNIVDSLSNSQKSNLYICKSYWSAFFTLLKLRPTKIISSLWRSHFLSILYKLINPKTKKYHFIHNVRYAHVIDWFLTRLSITFSDYILCDSEKTHLAFIGILSSKSCSVIPMSVTFSNGSKVDFNKHELRFVYVGRYAVQKNIKKSIDFIFSLKKITPGKKILFDLFGRDDGCMNELKDYISSLGLDDCITLNHSILPFLVEENMRKYNYYLQTSTHEGMAISVFQSIINGLFPVVTSVGEISSYTRHKFNAFHLTGESDKDAQDFFDLIFNSKLNLNAGCLVNEDVYPVYSDAFISKVLN